VSPQGGGGRKGDRPVPAEDYYGRPIIKPPVWEEREIAGYLFLGGLAGASSILAAGADLTGRPTLARGSRLMACGAVGVSLLALIKDLGRPERFLNMLRVFKPTSPMSVGVWILAAYSPLAAGAAASDFSGRMPRAGRAAGLGAAGLGSAVATYTAALISNTAVPAWHEGRGELPFLFAGSAASAAAGWGLVVAPLSENKPAVRMAIIGAAVELGAERLMERHLARRNRLGAIAAGAALLTGSALTRFGIFEAGMTSARDPKYTVEPQRARSERSAPSRVE
jgi:formate-dependent nitrite reductase membrane component NrfD